MAKLKKNEYYNRIADFLWKSSLNFSFHPPYIYKCLVLRRNINLRVLEISSCSTLTRIQGQSFNLLRNLENVTISFNPELEEIEDGVFSSEMSTLVHLDISQNDLK